MAQLELGQPNIKQELFFMAKKKYIGFGGARGGGKSWAVRTKAALLALRFKGIKIMIIRKTYPELTENHINPMVTLLKCYAENRSDRVASYNDAKKTITFPNGSRILFRYCRNDADAERFQGTEVDILFVDEATHQSEERFKKFTACVRGVNNFPKRVYITCNPGGEGHSWVKRLFIDHKYEKDENPEDYTFIQSLVTDNVALMESDPGYKKQLEALPPKLRKAWLEGEWDVYEGQFFEDFRSEPDKNLCAKLGLDIEEAKAQRRCTHVIDPFEIPADWTIYRSLDWGYSKPFSSAWYAIDQDGVAYRILELYGCDLKQGANVGVKWTPEKVFSEVKRIESEHRWLKGKHIIGVGDPAIWDAQKGMSIGDTALKYGISYAKGLNSRIQGWMQCHYRLQFDDNGYPMFYCFSNCKQFIRTIPTLIYDDIKVEDLDTSMEDHIADEWRYFLMQHMIKPTVPTVDTYKQSPLYQALDIEKSELTAPTRRPRIQVMREE